MKKTLKTLMHWCLRILFILLMLLAVVGGFGYWLSPPQVDFNSPYHPFVSAQAQINYLAAYDKRAQNWPVASSERIVETSQGRTFVRISGADNSAAMLLLHGSGGNSLQWLSAIEKLSAVHKVFALDIMFDYGRSIPHQEFNNVEDYMLWLNEVMEQLSPMQKVNIVGLSYGAWIAGQYAQHYPEKIEKVVLLAPAGVVAPLSEGFIARAVSVMLPTQFFTRNFIYWLAQDTFNQGAEKKQLLEEHIAEAYLAISSFTSRQMVYPNVFSDQQLANLKAPVLFMVGENEKIYSAELALQRLADAAPNIHTKIIRGAGHDLIMAQPEQVAEQIVTFLDSKLK